MKSLFGTSKGGGGGTGRRDLFPYLLILPVVLSLALVNLYPVLSALRLSTVDYNLMLGDETFVGLENYADAIRDSVFWRVLANTLVWTVGSIAVATPLGLAAALLLHRPIRGRGVFRALALVPWVTPPVVVAFMWTFLVSDTFSPISAVLQSVGLIARPIPFLGGAEIGAGPLTLPMMTVMAVNIWGGFPFLMVVFLAGLQSIPDELYEAARIDGAGAWQRFRNVTLPLLWPLVEITILLDAIWQFGRFNLNYLMTGGGPFNATNILAVYIFQNAFQLFRFGYGAAVGVIMFLVMLPAAIVYVAAARRRIAAEGV